MMNAVTEPFLDVDLPLPDRRDGKVRVSYEYGHAHDGTPRRLFVTTDRLSAFDHVLTTLPFKGDLLNQLSHFWFQRTAHIVKNHVLDLPDPCVIVARLTRPLPIEFVVRGSLTDSLLATQLFVGRREVLALGQRRLDPREQLRRFQERERLDYKRWKITEEDWRNRKKAGVYRGAIEEMLYRTSTPQAPWR